MKWAVIGSRGMLGTEVVNLLRHRGQDVLEFNRENLKPDFKQFEIAKAFEGVDVVINAAAYTRVDLAETEVAEAYFTNAELPRRLVAASELAQAKFVQISTDYVFRGDSPVPYLPEDSPDPISVYGKSKLEGEKAVLNYRDTKVIRTAWLYGKFGNCFPKTISSRLLSGQEVKIVDDQFGSPTSTRDLARYIVNVSSIDGLGQVFHGVSEGVTSWFEFGVKIANHLAVSPDRLGRISTKEFNSPASRPLMSIAAGYSHREFRLPSWELAWEFESGEILGPPLTDDLSKI